VIQSADGYLEDVTVGSRPSFSAAQWLTLFYSSISFILLFSMAASLGKIWRIIRSHTVKWIQDIRFINTRVPGTPFSFFRFIFWNEEIDLQTETGRQIFQHEMVHVKERHTLDKLFLQLVLIVFWCNPFFWLMRRELKLIHEFIADQKAIGEQGMAALAAMILNSSYPAQFHSMTSQFFQNSIKRRLAMLKKIQNPRINYLSRVMALPILALTVLAFTLRTKSRPEPVKLQKVFTVVIDAAHGKNANGTANGARSGNVYEDDIVLAIAKKINELNANDKIRIVMTRPNEAIVDLHRRVDIAAENKADLFISLHLNASPNDKDDSSGIEIYVSNKNIPFQKESEVLGSLLQQELSSVYPTKPYLKKRPVGVWVLDRNTCPTVLVECGYVTNAADRKFVTNEENQTAIAHKILAAVERYASMDGKTGGTAIPQYSAQKTKDDKIVVESDEIIFKSPGKKESASKSLIIINGEMIKASSLEGKQVVAKKLTVYKENDEEAVKMYGEAARKGVMVFEDGVIKDLPKTNQKTDTLPKQKSGNREVTGMKVIPARDKVIITYSDNEKDSMSIEEAKKKFKLPPPPPGSEGDIVIQKEPVFSKVEVEASIPMKDWVAFLTSHLRPVVKEVSKTAPPATYTVNIKFLVSKDGSLSGFEALNDPGYGMPAKIIEVMKQSPKWTPGMQNGRPVNSYHTQPVTLIISKG
jgi:N-acetylmuramoyl-L-alanine amidase